MLVENKRENWSFGQDRRSVLCDRTKSGSNESLMLCYESSPLKGSVAKSERDGRVGKLCC